MLSDFTQMLRREPVESPVVGVDGRQDALATCRGSALQRELDGVTLERRTLDEARSGRRCGAASEPHQRTAAMRTACRPETLECIGIL
jgi:hypothetical protein